MPFSGNRILVLDPQASGVSGDMMVGALLDIGADTTRVVEAMKACSKCLVTFGGHPLAAGFKIKNKDLGKFKQCLNEYFESC